MAKTLVHFPAGLLDPDTDAQLDAGDSPARQVRHEGRDALALDDTIEEAFVSPMVPVPTNYAGGSLNVVVQLYTDTAATGNVDIEIAFEAITPSSDTLDLVTASSFAAVRAGTHALGGTAGDLRTLTIAFTTVQADNFAAGDMFRIAGRRDADDATNDTATGDVFIAGITVEEQ